MRIGKLTEENHERIYVFDDGDSRGRDRHHHVESLRRLYLWPSVLVVLGYGVAFWGLSMVVKSMPLGIVYAIWSGMGIVLVSVAAVFVYQQKLDWPAIVGMGLIIAGVLVINLLSKASVH